MMGLVATRAHHLTALEEIDEHLNTPEIDDYLRDLLIDKRGGHKGFSPEATCLEQSVRNWFGWIGLHSGLAMAAG